MTGQSSERHGSRGRLRVTVHGAVQGVGFRPFVFGLAGEMGLSGWVRNFSEGVSIEVEGPIGKVCRFYRRMRDQPPSCSLIQAMDTKEIELEGGGGFEIPASDSGGALGALVLPDLATCSDCQREIFNPPKRRYRDLFVGRMRERKHRVDKPLAVMFPSLAAIEEICELSPSEAGFLNSAEAPIVLLRKRVGTIGLALGVAPGNRWIASERSAQA